jgi:Acetoacetate decarboxylase (ADC)
VTAQIEWLQSSVAQDLTYPAAPWQVVGSNWMTVFRLGTAADERHPAGLYGVAFVTYDEGSPLTYHELAVSRVLKRSEGRAVTTSDIWVDSPESKAGGRELWAIPKELCDFTLDTSHTGPLSTTEWVATVGRTPIASARFRDVSRMALRLPFKGTIRQPGIEDTNGEDRTISMQGSARSLPARSHWDINPDGPLGWLGQARKLATVRQASFRMSFG